MATANEDDFSIKGAALRHEDPTSDTYSQANEKTATEKSNSREASPDLEAGEVDERQDATSDQPTDTTKFRWCKCACDPAAAETYGRDHYFLHFDTQESRWDEPGEPYWVWDAMKQSVDEHGLRYPAGTTQTENTAPSSSQAQPEEEYQGYNPKIHGAYDPNADYAQWHKRKHQAEDGVQPGPQRVDEATGQYLIAAQFNRFTGSFQTDDKSVERHSDHAKSGRQLNAFFDLDSAANANDGRSLKAERQQQKLSKKEVRELAKKKREKKVKKRLDWYKT